MKEQQKQNVCNVAHHPDNGKPLDICRHCGTPHVCGPFIHDTCPKCGPHTRLCRLCRRPLWECYC